MEGLNENELWRTCQSLFQTATADRGLWQGVVEKVIPNIVDAAYLREHTKTAKPRQCPRANVNIHKLTAAHMSYIFPVGQQWFRFESWNPETPDSEPSTEDFFAQVTDIVRREIERSNFYTEVHSMCLDRCAAGTGCIFVEMNADTRRLEFTHIPVGTYAIAQDNTHTVNTLVRKFHYTPVQMADEFGEDALSPAVRKLLGEPESKYSSQVEIWHLTIPRGYISNERYTTLPKDRNFASFYIEADTKHVLLESGFFEFPYIVTRFLRVGNAVYGESPLLGIQDTINDLISADESLKIMGRRAALPSMAFPSELLGQVDLRGGGQTIIPQQYIDRPHAIREIAPVANFPLAMESKNSLELLVDDGLHIGAMQVFAGTDRNMTATEVAAREEEKMVMFYPSFAQNMADFTPGLNRIFGLCYRAGLFASLDIPQEVADIVVNELDEVEAVYLNMPKVAYVGRMAQALERVRGTSIQDIVSVLINIAQAIQDPSLLMQIDWMKLARYLIIVSGMPIRFLKPWDDVMKEMETFMTTRERRQALEEEKEAAEADQNRAKAQNLRSQYNQNVAL